LAVFGPPGDRRWITDSRCAYSRSFREEVEFREQVLKFVRGVESVLDEDTSRELAVVASEMCESFALLREVDYHVICKALLPTDSSA